MKWLPAAMVVALIFSASWRLQSQNNIPESSGALLLRVQAGNRVILEKQATLLKSLEATKVEARQVRIKAKRT